MQAGLNSIADKRKSSFEVLVTGTIMNNYTFR